MAQNNFINGTYSSIRDSGAYRTQLSHGSASAADVTFSWDSTKLTTKSALTDFLQKCQAFVNSRNDIPV